MSEFRFDPQIFVGYIEPHGYLTDNPATHACFYYYLLARRGYERVEIDPVVWEGDADPTVAYHQLWTSIARMYNVEIGAMAQCWEIVDKQCYLLGLPKLPEGDRYRHDAITIITSH